MLRAFFSHVNRNIVNRNNLVMVLSRRELKYKPIETSNKITVGHKMTQVIEKKRSNYMVKKASEEKYSRSPTTLAIDKEVREAKIQRRRLLIAAFNPQFNHYTDQVYKDFSERNFASYGWKNRRSRDQYFTINAIGSHPSIIDVNKMRTADDQVIDFSNLLLNESIVSRLKSAFDITRPTYIQYLSLNETLKRDSHILVIAETGGGKTICYALPMLEYSVRIRHQLQKQGIERARNQPVAIVLVPTRELAFQVYDTFKRLISAREDDQSENKSYSTLLSDLTVAIDLHASQIKAKEVVSGERVESFESDSTKPVDILITLPGQLEDRLRDKKSKWFIDSAYLRSMAIDETDTLFDDSFSPVTLKCMQRLQMNFTLPKNASTFISQNEQEECDRSPEEIQEMKKIDLYLKLDESLKDPSTQMMFASATVPHNLRRVLEQSFDWNTQLRTIKTSRINRLMLHVPQKFIRTNGTKRPNQLLELVNRERDKVKNSKIMVFCYKTKTAQFVTMFLKENGVENVDMLSKKLNNRERQEVVKRFMEGDSQVLVCTDIASRGWNTIQVNHVVNFEMPQFIADYLHRVGRVGRLGSASRGSTGLVTNFIVTRSDVDLVWNIERSIRLGVELEHVDANVKGIYQRYGAETNTNHRRANPEMNQEKGDEKQNQEEKEEEVDEVDEVEEVDETEETNTSSISRRPRTNRKARIRT